MPNPTPFKDLAGYMDKQTIACVEGKLTKVQEKTLSGTGQYGDWVMQFSSMRDTNGQFHDVTVTDEACFFLPEMVGKSFRMESQPQSKGGPAGVCMSVRSDKKTGDEKRSIKVDNRAKITPLDGSTSSVGGSSAPTQGRGVSEQSRASVESIRDQSTVDERLDHQFRLFEAAWKRSKATEKELGITFTVEDIRAFTNTIGGTFKGEYGCYAPPIWEKPLDWRSVKTGSGKMLGEMGDIELASVALKVLGMGAKSHEDPKVKLGLDGTMKAIAEKGWEPVKVASLAAEGLEGMMTRFFIIDLFKVAKKDTGAESETDITLEQWAGIFSNPKSLIAACVQEADSHGSGGAEGVLEDDDIPFAPAFKSLGSCVL